RPITHSTSRRILLVLLVMILVSGVTARDTHAQQPPQPPSNKLTLAYYDFSSGAQGVDANIRHSFPSMTAWLGVYHEDDGFDQTRLGYEYDYHSHWLTLV